MPLKPIIVPTADIELLLEITAILVLKPGILAIFLISMIPS
jgi:hypothetical protein